MTNCRWQVPAIICPDVEYTTEYDELHLIPSSPPRRLSRSSIDLRDLELEREKTIAQTSTLASESVSSIYHRFDGQIRYSGSEPINTNNIKQLENQFQMKSKDASSDETNGESKISIPYTNNFENVVTSSASIVKDNPVNVSSSSSNNSNNAHGRKSTTTNKKKMLASSDSDFFLTASLQLRAVEEDQLLFGEQLEQQQCRQSTEKYDLRTQRLRLSHHWRHEWEKQATTSQQCRAQMSSNTEQEWYFELFNKWKEYQLQELVGRLSDGRQGCTEQSQYQSSSSKQQQYSSSP